MHSITLCKNRTTVDGIYVYNMYHTLITWPLASKQTLSYATPQCVGILLTFYI